jgi:hypothetical protein
MLKYLAVSLLAFLLLGGVPAAYADDGIVGTVLKVEGSATLTLAGQKNTVPAKAQTHIHMHDILATSGKSKLFVLFIDNTQFTLGPDTKLTVNEYVYDPNNTTNDKARYGILAGAFDYVSGLVAKKKDPDVQVQTPSGAIGIRGTNFWGGNTGGSSYGFHVSEGKIGVSNGGGSVTVGAGQGTIVPGPNQPPGPPGPWGPDLLALVGGTTGMGGLGPLISGQQGKNHQLVIDFNKNHHHGQQGDNGPDLRGKDLPQDETGEPDMVPFSPGQGGGGFGGN